jgi:hypothetical protein
LEEDLISLVVSRIECYSSCNVLKVENLYAIECGVVREFIAPTTKIWPLEDCCRMAHRTVRCATGHCPVRHRTLSGAPATSASRWGSTVGALTCGASGLSDGAPDRSCRLSGAPTARALSSARRRALNALQSSVARGVVVAPLAHRIVRCDIGHCPVLHRAVR